MGKYLIPVLRQGKYRVSLGLLMPKNKNCSKTDEVTPGHKIVLEWAPIGQIKMFWTSKRIMTVMYCNILVCVCGKPMSPQWYQKKEREMWDARKSLYRSMSANNCRRIDRIREPPLKEFQQNTFVKLILIFNSLPHLQNVSTVSHFLAEKKMLSGNGPNIRYKLLSYLKRQFYWYIIYIK